MHCSREPFECKNGQDIFSTRTHTGCVLINEFRIKRRDNQPASRVHRQLPIKSRGQWCWLRHSRISGRIPSIVLIYKLSVRYLRYLVLGACSFAVLYAVKKKRTFSKLKNLSLSSPNRGDHKSEEKIRRE